VGIFTVSSFLCGIAPSLGFLIFFRVMQGLGGGALQPISQAILVESFPRHKQGMAMAVYGMGVVVAPVIGPTLGGWITDNFSWGWIFFINIPVGILSLLLTSALIHDPPYLVRKSLGSGFKIDYIGFGLLAMGLGSLEIVLDEGQRNDWFGSNFIVAFAIAAVIGLIGVVVWELRQKQPVIDFHVLKERNFALATLCMLVLGFVLYGSTTLLPLFLQTLLGYTALLSGLVLSPGGVAICICMPIVGMLLRKYQARWLIIFGVLVSAFGLLAMSRFNLEVDYTTAVWGRVVQSTGLAFLFVPISTVAFARLPRERVNYATGLFNLARNIGGSSGIAAITTILARRAQYHQSILVSHLTPYDSAYRDVLRRTAQALQAGGASGADAAVQAQGAVSGTLLKQSTMLAFSDAFFIMGVLFLVIVPLMFLIKKTPPPRQPVMVE
jgi:DHA2 family multidrug resistance protein